MNLSFPNEFLYEFATLIVVLDPLATVPVFLAVTHDLNRKDAFRVALYTVVISFLILLFFIIFGQYFLNALNIPMASFQLAGSIILFLLGLEMIRGRIVDENSTNDGSRSLIQRAAYPLAIPVIAGAGGILTVVMLTNNATRTVVEQVQTTIILALCLSVHLISFSIGHAIKKYLGKTGIETIGRIFGLILASIAVSGIITAIKISFGLT